MSMYLDLDNENAENDENDLNFDIENFKDIEEILNEDEYNEDEYNEYENEEIPNKKKSKYSLITRRIDCNRIRHKTVKNVEVYTSLLKNVKIELENPVRCGAIIYTKKEGKTYFCLGVDSSYGDLTDFSGGIKKEESLVEGGLRELEEESQNVFGNINQEDIKDCMSFYTKNMMIIFIHKNVDMEEIKKEFNEKIIGKTELEVSNICWLEKEDFINSINGKGKRMYSRVRKILSKVTNIISEM